MECRHHYLCSYTAPTLDTTCDNKWEQLRFHDLSTWSKLALPSNFFSTKWVEKAENRRLKANEGGIQIEKKTETRSTNLDKSRLQANLAVLSTRGEHKQKTKTNELSENDGHGIAGCLDLSNTAKIQAGVAGHQFQPECYCYSGRTASCYWVWTWNRTGAVGSQPKSGHQQLYERGIWIHELQNSPQNKCHHQCHAATCYDDFGWPNCRELKLWHAFCVFDGPTKGCLNVRWQQAYRHVVGWTLCDQHTGFGGFAAHLDWGQVGVVWGGWCCDCLQHWVSAAFPYLAKSCACDWGPGPLRGSVSDALSFLCGTWACFYAFAHCRGAKFTKKQEWSMEFCCSCFRVQMHKPLVHDSQRASIYHQGTEASLLELRGFMTLRGLGFPDSPNTTGWPPLVFQGLAPMDQLSKSRTKTNLQAKYRTPQMPLAARHWFSEGSKSRSQ